jgi:hypothetical protein
VRLRKSRAVRFSVDQPVARPKPCDSSHAVAPTAGFNPTRPANALSSTTPKGKRTAACRQLSWSSFPLRRLSPGESTPPRLASPGTFRPQGFAPSRRFAPRLNARPCFMPETPMGFFALQGVSLTARFPDSSPRNCLLDVSPHTNESSMRGARTPHAETRFSGLCRLQGLAPTANPYHRRIVTSCAMADPLLSFGRLSRVLPLLTGHVTGYVCHSCAFPVLGSASVRGQAHVRQQRRLRRTAGKPTILLRQCPRSTTGQARNCPRTVSSFNHGTSPQLSSDRQDALQRFRPKARDPAP